MDSKDAEDAIVGVGGRNGQLTRRLDRCRWPIAERAPSGVEATDRGPPSTDVSRRAIAVERPSDDRLGNLYAVAWDQHRNPLRRSSLGELRVYVNSLHPATLRSTQAS